MVVVVLCLWTARGIGPNRADT